MKVIDNFLNVTKRIKFINHGGCLITCYAFYKYLKANNVSVDTYDIIQYSAYKHEIEQNVRFLEENAGLPTSAYHFTFTFDNKEYDGEGEFDSISYIKRNWISEHIKLPLKRGQLNFIEEFCVTALNESGWNSTFAREYWIPVLEKDLSIDLSAIDL